MRNLLICLPLLLLAAAPSSAGEAKDVAGDKEFDKLPPEALAFVIEAPKAHEFKKTLKRQWTKKELEGGTSQWLVIRLSPKQYSGKQAENAWRKKAPVSILGRRPQRDAVQKVLKLKKLSRLSIYVAQDTIIRDKGGRYIVRRLSTFKKNLKNGVYLETKPKADKPKADKPKDAPTSGPTSRPKK
tara:strand:+ start:1424 stop:1978 length:555 start_codon:yes stop_codon:yes gene_type:complete